MDGSGAGDDKIKSGKGNDINNGGAGNDKFQCGKGNDSVNDFNANEDKATGNCEGVPKGNGKSK